MRPRPITLFFSALATSLLFATASSATVGLGLTAVALTKPNHGDATVSPISNVSVELPLDNRFAIGAAYSSFEAHYSDAYYRGQDSGITEVGEKVVSAYLAVSLYQRDSWRTYAKVGGGWYKSSFASSATSSAGVYGGVGERVTVSRRLSVSLEAQYHFAGFDSDDDYPPTGELFRLIAGIEVWIGSK